MQIDLLTETVDRRLDEAAGQIAHSLAEVSRGNPFGAEPSNQRLVDRLRLKSGLSEAEARDLAQWIRSETPSPGDGEEKTGDMEALIGSSLDFVGVAFFDRGRAVADAVVRIRFRDGRPQGTGVLIAPGVIMTNNHVISSPADAGQFVVEFGFKKNAGGERTPVTSFELEPRRLFVTDPRDRLDFTLVALGVKSSGPRELSSFPFVPLSDMPNKHMLGEVANIIQHPRGDFKQAVLRENRLVARLDDVLHYVADTLGGSSGSPVFNNEWQMIALHHWGGPGPMALAAMPGNPPSAINEGVRVSSIVRNLRARASGSDAANRQIRALLDLWDSGDRMPAVVSRPVISGQPRPPKQRVEQQERGHSMANRSDEDFSDRAGYEPGFLSDFIVPLPVLRDTSMGRPARNLDARIGEDPHELKYHHFSIVMNGDRRLAYYTACNIDGKLTRHINRRDKSVNMNPTAADLQIESMGPEASDDFSTDWRINPDQQMGAAFYEKQKVPGYPDTQDRNRIARMFQKGHIIMRSDPAWGTREMALAAEQDSFFYTNAAPQLGYFNQGSRDTHPGEKGKLRWRAVETYVLRNAVEEKERVCVFAGPVFTDDDPVYRGHPVPMAFWKIVVWSDGGTPRSIALIASQREVLDQLTEGVPESFENTPEAYDDLPELARVKEFRTTVLGIEELTHLTFPDLVREADIGKDLPEGTIRADAITTTDSVGRAAGQRPADKPAKASVADRKRRKRKS
ncbi:DNA/RNA non-specific endonuclease [Aestuariivirga sp.]|uniref:DNA/RNA non-specific endonuclease n=1 Tax=Aestuariivirga sp. TaxID=2650926 RepID=UPI0025C617F1|nr:DNA/RNA non-specific endonuclease [Aestuariivirga sp.]MCA3555163.1 DNA/RNA non-specific endonuclease [Aestuariivirga sp.]